MSEEEKESRQQEVNTIKAIMKDHSKMSSIIQNRLRQIEQIANTIKTSSPEDLLVSEEHMEENAFVEELCKQRDMFVVADVLKRVFKDDSVLSSMSLTQANMILKKLQTDHFLSDSKYRIHKESWLRLTTMLVTHFCSEIREHLSLIDDEVVDFTEILRSIQNKLRIMQASNIPLGNTAGSETMRAAGRATLYAKSTRLAAIINEYLDEI